MINPDLNNATKCNKLKDKQKGKSWVGEFPWLCPGFSSSSWIPILRNSAQLWTRSRTLGPWKRVRWWRYSWCIRTVRRTRQKSWWIPLAQQKFLMECLLSDKSSKLNFIWSTKNDPWVSCWLSTAVGIRILLFHETQKPPFFRAEEPCPLLSPKLLVQIGADEAAKQSCHLRIMGDLTWFGHTQKAQSSNENWAIWIMGVVTSQNGTRKKITWFFATSRYL